MKNHLIRVSMFLIFFGLIESNISAQSGILLKTDNSCLEGVAEFKILNIGKNILPPDSIFYIVIEDQIIARQGQIDSLKNSDKLTVSLPAQTTNYQLDVFQGLSNSQPFHQSSLICPVNETTASLKHWSLGFQVGTLGPGLVLEKQFNNSLSLRAGGTYLPYNFDLESPFDYSNLEITTKVGTAGLMLDWFMSSKPDALFHLTAGGLYNFSEFDFFITPEQEWVDKANFATTLEDIGDLKILAKPQKFNPYFGLGIGRMGSSVKKVGGKFELGVFYVGETDIEMEGSGAVAPTATQAEIIESNISGYTWYPNINFIISFKL